MAPISLSTLTNPLLTSSQLLTFKNSLTEQITSRNFTQSLLTNSAGVLLRLPHEVTAQALVLLQRYQVLSAQLDALLLKGSDAKIISAAVVYLAAKLSFTPVSPRSVVNVYAYLTSSASPLWFVNPPGTSTSSPSTSAPTPDPKTYYVSEGTYEREKIRLFTAETHILSTLGFDTHVVLPHPLALTYIQALGVTESELPARVFEYLNGGLVSDQLIYLTHQPNALAVAAIYLAAREVGVKLVEENWWEVFDVDREDLGFLVMAFGSLGGFAVAERGKVEGGKGVVSLMG